MLEKLLSQCQRLDRITQQVYATDIKQIEQELKRQLNLEKSWSEFKIQFDKVHPEFFEKLIDINNTITLHDCKVAALIRMGLSNQEIAEFTNVAKVSVRKTLNRLKKKLDISAEDGLKEFLFHLK
jgi:DNA-binding NarL/FixJ family response regulator